ncbi:hypothetical protein Tco_1571234, partial [Tanacetum coccineum]
AVTYEVVTYKVVNEVGSVLREASTSRSFSKTRVMDVESDDGGDDDWTQSSLLKEVKCDLTIVAVNCIFSLCLVYMIMLLKTLQ